MNPKSIAAALGNEELVDAGRGTAASVQVKLCGAASTK